MKGTWRLARIAGVDINVHWSFSLIILWIILHGVIGQRALTSTILVLAATGLLFVCVILHELGHALTALWLQVEVKAITVLPIGGLAQIQSVPGKPFQEFLITLAGPLVNLAIVAMLMPCLYLLDEMPLFWGFVASPETVGEAILLTSLQQANAAGLVIFLLLINGALFIFNLVPAFPLDGGRLLRALLATFISYHLATRIALGVSQILAGILILAALWLRNPGLILIAIFLFIVGRLGYRRRGRVEPTH